MRSDFNAFDLDHGESKLMSAAEFQDAMTDRGSPANSQARELLKYYTNCGTYLTALHKSDSPYVTHAKRANPSTLYEITRPEIG